VRVVAKRSRTSSEGDSGAGDAPIDKAFAFLFARRFILPEVGFSYLFL
jgi:hypothetical protein